MSNGLRLRLFFALFGIGCLAHELQFVAKQYRWAGNFRLHLERWEEVSPVFTALPPVIGYLIHFAIAILAIVLIFSQRQQRIVTLLAVFVVLSLFTIAPPGISNHYIVVAFALVGAVGFDLLSRLAARTTPNPGESQRHIESDNTDFCTAMKHLFTITYFFAAFHKLNAEWFNVAKTSVREFIIPYVTPLLALAPESSSEIVHAAVVVGVYSTIVIELSLPFLLLCSATRTFGCLLGVTFNLIIMGQGIVDYPAIVLAFLPLFFSEEELRSLLSRLVSHVTVGRVSVAVFLGAYLYICSPGGVIKAGWRLLLSPGGYSLIMFSDTLLRYGLVFGWIYIGCTIAQELIEEVLLKTRSILRVAPGHNS